MHVLLIFQHNILIFSTHYYVGNHYYQYASSSGSVIGHKKWASGQLPTIVSNDKCLQLVIGGGGYELKMEPCSNTAAFVCEYDGKRVFFKPTNQGT